MADYWGLESICGRMGWHHHDTPVRQLKSEGFLMFKRRRGKHPRVYWYTNDSLISAWEIAKCKAERETLLERDKQGSKLGD